MRRLAGHPWPGNVRELLFVVERALVLGIHATVDAHTIEGVIADAAVARPVKHAEDALLRHRLTTVLARNNGRTEPVAQEMGVDRSTIYRWMRRFGVETPMVGGRADGSRHRLRDVDDAVSGESGRMTVR